MVHIKELLLLIEKKVAHVVVAAGVFDCLSGLLSYVCSHVTINKM